MTKKKAEEKKIEKRGPTRMSDAKFELLKTRVRMEEAARNAVLGKDSKNQEAVFKEVTKPYQPPFLSKIKGKIADTKTKRLYDAAPMDMEFGSNIGWNGGSGLGPTAQLSPGVGFVGYQALAILTLRTEYHNLKRALIDAAFRSWGKWETNNPKEVELCQELNDALIKYKFKKKYQKSFEHDFWYGQGFLVMCMTGENNSNQPLKLTSTARSMAKGLFSHFANVEPIWCWAAEINTSNALEDNDTFYSPTIWNINGSQVHSDRIIRTVTQEVSDVFKPAYNYGGAAKAHGSQPFIQRIDRNSQHASDILSTVRLRILTTPIENVLSEEGMDELFGMLDILANQQNNMGTLAIGSNQDVKNLQTNLNGIPEIQEMGYIELASNSMIPIIELTGNQPAGLNASSEGVLRVSNNRKKDMRENHMMPAIMTASNMLQIHLWGEIKLKNAQWVWEPLDDMSVLERAEALERIGKAIRGLSDVAPLSGDQARNILSSNTFGCLTPKLAEDVDEDDGDDTTDE